MSTLAKIVFDFTLIALLLLGYLNEDKVIEFEKKAFERILKRFTGVIEGCMKPFLFNLHFFSLPQFL